jgi:hypothetical protein
MAKKIYSVTWGGPDGKDGYFVELSPKEVTQVKDMLAKHETDGKISDISVDAIEKPWLLTKAKFLQEMRERMET